MTARFFTSGDIPVLSNPGVASAQLMGPLTSSDAAFAITRVTVAPGAVQARHAHDDAEQVWVALAGTGHLLLEGETRRAFSKGEVARFPPGTVHGFENTSDAPFEYLTVTCPPLDHSSAYEKKR